MLRSGCFVVKIGLGNPWPSKIPSISLLNWYIEYIPGYRIVSTDSPVKLRQGSNPPGSGARSSSPGLDHWITLTSWSPRHRSWPPTMPRGHSLKLNPPWIQDSSREQPTHNPGIHFQTKIKLNPSFERCRYNIFF